MIRIDHLALPPGLDAIARRTGRGELYVVISDALDPGRQRAAVRAAVRAARRHAWEFGMLPLPLAAAPALRGAVRQAIHFLRAHGAVSAVAGSLAAGSVAATAAVFIVAAPPHGNPAALTPNAPGYTQSSGGHSRHPAAGTRHGTSAPGQHGGTSGRVITVATPKNPKPRPRPEPNPSASSTSPPVKSSPPTTSTGTTSPSPTPSPTSTSPSSGGKGTCVIILGVEVCL
jgi:hypothetical protein